MPTFARVDKHELGYRASEVDHLMELARAQYENSGSHILNWQDLSKRTFSTEKGGYQPKAVDAAIEKLQDTFAERTLRYQTTNLADLRSLLLGRISRPKGKQFQSVGFWKLGYSKSQVQKFLKELQESLEGGEPLKLDYVRQLAFATSRGGFSESQVDAFIDKTLEFAQVQRFSKPKTGSGDTLFV